MDETSDIKYICLFVIFFFFQAEDGIRDIGVTGVQTCALPILGASRWRLLSEALAESLILAVAGSTLGIGIAYALLQLFVRIAPQGIPRLNQEIGRASCRERV